jgi:hypothetical protein
MAYSALSPLSAGVFAKLNVTSLKGAYPGTGAGCTGGVKDYVPQAPTYPFLWYELSENDISGLGNGPSVKQIQLRLHVFSQFLGMAEAQRIMAAAIGLLQFVEPTATGWQVPAIGRPDDVIPIEFSEINGIVVRELVSIWDDFFACENAA